MFGRPVFRHELSRVRSEAFYEADEKHSENAQVVATRKSGIRARVFASRTPADILTHLCHHLFCLSRVSSASHLSSLVFASLWPESTRYLKDLNNQFHHGGGISFVELVSGVADVDEATAKVFC